MEDHEATPLLPLMHAVASKALTEKCKPQALAYCPTMDLVALATENENLHVFRLNGQKVFGTSYSDAGFNIVWLRWKPNGSSLSFVPYLGRAC